MMSSSCASPGVAPPSSRVRRSPPGRIRRRHRAANAPTTSYDDKTTCSTSGNGENRGTFDVSRAMTMKQMMLVFWRPGRRDLVRSTHTTIKRGWGGDRVARINGERVVEPRRRPLMARASSVPGETRGRGSFDQALESSSHAAVRCNGRYTTIKRGGERPRRPDAAPVGRPAPYGGSLLDAGLAPGTPSATPVLRCAPGRRRGRGYASGWQRDPGTPASLRNDCVLRPG